MSYRWSNLTEAVRDQHSPLRSYLDWRFPRTRMLQRGYREGGGELLVDGGGAPGTVGAAFDLMIRFALDESYEAKLALEAFRSPQQLRALKKVVKAAQHAVTTNDLDQLARASWALALAIEVYRVRLRPGSPLTALRHDQFTPSALFALASDDARRQLQALYTLAQVRLLPQTLPAQRIDLGPTFDGSEFCAADADVISDGCLLDLKTRLGISDSRTGRRSDRLPLADLHQLLGYVLFDRSDRYAIRSIGIYSARYGYLVTWPLSEALTTLAGCPIDLAAEREVVWRILGGPCRAAHC
ncbi:MAG: hypothetical protein Q4G45_10325 [Actinomycetia bacterium]|nr:hypothetical protein [Actinomycetes bacterium]